MANGTKARGSLRLFRTLSSRPALLVLATSALLLGILGVAPAGPALVTGSVLGLSGVFLAMRDGRLAVVTRREADRLLAGVAGAGVPEALDWRAAELTHPRERRALARSLRGLLRSLELPAHVTAVVVNRAALWRNRHAVAALAERLEHLESPVHPRGIVLVRDLLTASASSPLYDPAAGGELQAALVRARSAIEPP